MQKCLRDAEELKQEGNEHFRAKRWNEALATYRSGLGRLPKRRLLESEKGKVREAIDMDEDGGEVEDVDADKEDKSGNLKDADADTDTPVQTPSLVAELECAQARSVINANIAACFVKLVSTSASTYARICKARIGRMEGGRICMCRRCACSLIRSDLH